MEEASQKIKTVYYVTFDVAVIFLFEFMSQFGHGAGQSHWVLQMSSAALLIHTAFKERHAI